MSIRFDNRVAIVTGAGNGLGRSHALELARRGAKVVVNDLGGAVDGKGGATSAADAVVNEIKQAGGTAVANYDSVADARGAANIIQTAVDAFGTVDVLINNAGILRDKSFAKMDLADFEHVVQVHLMGSVYCTKAAWPIMQAQNYGRIVMTTSASGIFGNFGQSNYGAAKTGVVGLMNVLRQEGTKNGIMVNTVAPIAATRMTEALFPPKILPYLGPHFVTTAAVWLASEKCALSGEIISAGAGYYAKAVMVEAEGVMFNPEKPVSLEEFDAAYGRITDLSKATPFPNSLAEVEKVFKLTNKL